VCEGFFRAGIWSGLALFRDPGLYFDWTSDDDYWKLQHLWVKKVVAPSRDIVDPLFGWTVPKSVDNPLGITANLPYRVDYQKPALLFFGDSFVQGVTAMNERIPQRLGAYLPQVQVLNLGVRGYGLDQIYLRIQQARFAFKNPTILAGVLTVDIDRSVLQFRTGPKPYFSVDNGTLELRGIPVDLDPEHWLAQNPPVVTSYFSAFLKNQLRLLHSGNQLETFYRRDEKQAVNSRLFEEIVKEARAQTHPLLFVLFYNREELTYKGWRERFIKSEMKRLKAPYVDTKEVLVRKSVQSGIPVKEFYLPDGHLNSLGNQVVAFAIADKMKLTGSLSRMP